MKKEGKKIKKKKKKKMEEISVSEESDSMYDEESSEENPHGFIQSSQIAHYKFSRTELKADKKNIKESKEKFKHKPKEKKGGSSDREKKFLKPLMMVRAKKNKIRSGEKQLKVRIKNLKTQLGRVRSNKQAKKKLNRKIIKK